MAIYSVEVCRISYGFTIVNVEADSEAEAREKAIDEAYSLEFSESDCGYEVEDISIIK